MVRQLFAIVKTVSESQQKGILKNTQDAFYSDREDEINTTLRDMEQFKRLVLNGKPVILPRGGIGTGLACLPTKSPFIWKMLVEDFKNYGIILNESGFEKENKQ